MTFQFCLYCSSFLPQKKKHCYQHKNDTLFLNGWPFYYDESGKIYNQAYQNINCYIGSIVHLLPQESDNRFLLKQGFQLTDQCESCTLYQTGLITQHPPFQKEKSVSSRLANP